MQPLFAEVERVDLAVKVAEIGLRHPRIGGNNVDHVLLDHAGARELHGGNAHALLKAFRGLRVVVARNITADVSQWPTEAIEANTRPPRSSGRTRRKSLRWVPPS